MSVEKAAAIAACNAATMALQVAEGEFLEALLNGRHGNVSAFEDRLRALEDAEKHLVACGN